MSHNVFISYSNHDKPKADKVVTELEKRGIKCWIASRDLKPGISWGTAIVEAIVGSQADVAILSKNANNSSRVTREIERAISIGLDVIPFRLDKTTISGTLGYLLSTAHWIDGFPPPIEGHINRLAETIRVYIGVEVQTQKMKNHHLKNQIFKKKRMRREPFSNVYLEKPPIQSFGTQNYN